ncbi:MAG: nucleoside-diphosphate kinase [Verrucomicrobiia bacterium]
MAEELAYVLVNPYTLFKSRTGGVLARLMSRTALDLVAARVFAPSKELVEEYAATVVTKNDPQPQDVQELIRRYVLENYMPDPKTGRRKRTLMLLFQGDDAVHRVRNVVGNVTTGPVRGVAIRDTYGDYVLGPKGEAKYFEPAVLAAPTQEEATYKLKLWARHSDTDGGLVDNTIQYPAHAKPQRTLVLIKPDNFNFPSGRPGNVLDVFSSTGLYIVGMKVHQMSVAQAENFYGPVREQLLAKMQGMALAKVLPTVEQALEMKLPADAVEKLGNLLGPYFGEALFQQIVKFMTGIAPAQCDPGHKNAPGLAKCIAVVYEGTDAVRKIREVLGPTDPKKAGPGTIRREFGQSVMVNAAHASDSPDNAKREVGIINFQENNFKQIVEKFYGKLG